MESKSIDTLHRMKTGKVSDKWSSYLTYYDVLLSSLRNMPLSMLEIGVQNGGSLETWSAYFSEAQQFIGCDIDPKCEGLLYDDPRIKIVVGDANAAPTFQRILGLCSEFDLVIDDGSHVLTDIINSFLNYFPHVKPGGLYVVEDAHCLYLNQFGGGILNEYSGYAFFKKLIDVTSFEFWREDLSIQNYLRTFFDKRATPGFILDGWIDSIEFKNSIITIRKANKPGHEKLGDRITVGSLTQVQDWGGKMRLG